MAVRSAYGTIEAWNALTQAERDAFDGGWYDKLASAISDHPGALVANNYDYEPISDTDNSSIVSFPADINGYKITVNGKKIYKYNTTFTGNDFTILTTNGTIEITNLWYRPQNDKSNAFQSMVQIQGTGSGVVNFYKNYLDLNNYLCNGIWLFSGDTELNIYTNKCCCPSASVNHGLLWRQNHSGIVNVEKNTCYGAPYMIKASDANLTLKDNNATGCNVGINGTYTDAGGNATSDLTGSVGYQSLVATDVMVDPVGGDYTPVKDGGLQVTYSEPLIPGNIDDFNGVLWSVDNAYGGAIGIDPDTGLSKALVMSILNQRTRRIPNRNR
jgi:hypothetical protein